LQFNYHTGTKYGVLIAKFQIGFEFGEGIDGYGGYGGYIIWRVFFK